MPGKIIETSEEKKIRYAAARIARQRREQQHAEKAKTATHHRVIRRYAFIAREIRTGELLGYVESKKHFSKTSITLFDANRFYRFTNNPTVLIGKVDAIKKRMSATQRAEYDIFMVRIGSKKCPVKIDYHYYFANVKTNTKGNLPTTLPFTVK